VITEGGRIVCLAGQTADDSGKSLAGDFEGQARQIFEALDAVDATLQKADGKLADLVQMTVFVTDVRYGERLWQIRKEIFGDNFPARLVRWFHHGPCQSRRQDRNSRLCRNRKQIERGINSSR
jgi:enamine deaminase RidA (YjgF/YER057c/UK114 family)